MSDFPFSIPRRGDADVVNGVSYAGTTLTLTRAEGSDLTTTIATSDPTKIENGNSSMEIATSNGDCVFTPNGDAALTTTFAADGTITTNNKLTMNTATAAQDFLAFNAVQSGGGIRALTISSPADIANHSSPFKINTGNAYDIQTDGVTALSINPNGFATFTNDVVAPTVTLTGGLNIGGTQANGDAIKLTSQNPRFVTTNGFLGLHSEYNIEFETDQNGNNSGAEYKFSGRSSTGTPMSQRMNLNGGTGNLQIQGTLTQNHNFSDDRLKTDEAYLENATESIGKLSVQTYNKEKLLNFNLLERTGETVSEVGLIAQEVYYNAPEFRHLIETGYNKTYDASYTTYEDVSHTIWDGDVSNTTFEKVSAVVPKRLKTNTKIIPSEMDLSGVPIGEDPDYEAAGWSKEDPASVNYQGFIPYLIKSIQELTERLAALENN